MILSMLMYGHWESYCTEYSRECFRSQEMVVHDNEDEQSMEVAIKKGEYRKIRSVSENAQNVIEQILQVKPNKRPAASEVGSNKTQILRNRWFSNKINSSDEEI